MEVEKSFKPTNQARTGLFHINEEPTRKCESSANKKHLYYLRLPIREIGDRV